MDIQVLEVDGIGMVKIHLIHQGQFNTEDAKKYENDIYKLAVAYIELEREDRAHRQNQLAQRMTSRVFNNKGEFFPESLNEINIMRKKDGLSPITEKQARDLFWRINKYNETKNPDYYIKPRKTEIILNYL